MPRTCPRLGTSDYLVVGELGLDGDIRPVRGALPVTLAGQAAGLAGVIVPCPNLPEAGVVHGIQVLGADSLAGRGASAITSYRLDLPTQQLLAP